MFGGIDKRLATTVVIRIFLPIYRRLFDEDSDRVANLSKSLEKARFSTPVELYLARAMGVGFLIGIFLWALTTIVGVLAITSGMFEIGTVFGFTFPNNFFFRMIDAFEEWIVVIVSGIVFGLVGIFGVLVPAFMWPKVVANSRKSEIDVLMPDVISYMYALSVGGMNQIEIINKVAEAEDTYGEVAREFKSVVQETDYFDSDFRTAIEKQIEVTPSSSFAQFLSDMLSILDSGGDIEQFLQEKQHKHTRLAKQSQEQDLDTLELLGEIYMTVSLFPLLLIIILVIMSMLGRDVTMKLYGVVYGLIPMIGVAFLVLLSIVKQDEVGNGQLRHPTGASSYKQTRLTSFPIIDRFATGEYEIFDKTRAKEQTFQTIRILKRPHIFFKEHPTYTLLITIPSAIAIVGAIVLNGAVPTTFSEFKKAHVWGTFVYFYMPFYITLTPYAIFSFWKSRSVGNITGNLSDMLRKLSSANDAGQPLLESIQTVTQASSGQLADELDAIRSKVRYGARMREAFIDFNNKYSVPRLARIVKLIVDAQETSDDITEVLATAAETSENQDDIAREQKTKTRTQLVIIIMTYVILLGVMALLKVQFIEVMGKLAKQASSQSGGGPPGGGGGQSFGANVDVQMLSMLFFHAITLQAMISGFLGGYMRNNNLRSGIKYALPLVTLALGVWLYVA